jgi:hypothetical protein
MNLPELIEQSLSLLRRILERAHSRIPEDDPRWAFIHRHGRNICELGVDTAREAELDYHYRRDYVLYIASTSIGRTARLSRASVNSIANSFLHP